MKDLRRQLPSGIVEDYFMSRRSAGEADKTAPVHFTVYCPELAEDDAAPLLALKEVILSGEKLTLPGLSPAFSEACMLGALTVFQQTQTFTSYFKTSLPDAGLIDPIEAFDFDGITLLTSVEKSSFIERCDANDPNVSFSVNWLKVLAQAMLGFSHFGFCWGCPICNNNSD
jgi:hypothetical protein